MPEVEIANFSDNTIKHQIVPLVMKDLAEPFIYTSLACSLTFSRACSRAFIQVQIMWVIYDFIVYFLIYQIHLQMPYKRYMWLVLQFTYCCE